jgi:hypothetical protein
MTREHLVIALPAYKLHHSPKPPHSTAHLACNHSRNPACVDDRSLTFLHFQTISARAKGLRSGYLPLSKKQKKRGSQGRRRVATRALCLCMSLPKPVFRTVKILPTTALLTTKTFLRLGLIVIDFLWRNSPNSHQAILEVDQADDVQLSLLERKSWTHRLHRRLLPKRFRDLLPEPLPSNLPGPRVTSNPLPDVSKSPSVVNTAGTSATSSSLEHACDVVRQFFVSPRNAFGLFRQYNTLTPPSHDPEEHISIEDLVDMATAETPKVHPFHPYPNLNAFRLGEWYWNGGLQKSQASFKDLLSIVGDPQFAPTDVSDVRWDAVNHALAHEVERTDEDLGWERTPVSITVPFQNRRGVPTSPSDGPKEYMFPDFYHRSLVSVIKEKLASPNDDPLFHYQPYNVKWQPSSTSEPLNVYGEFYTSQAFIDADRELQNMPPEPKCDLPRHIVALMFHSDATHLASFGDAKLWPLYLYFGNESKYRRVKPSCHLANHVAYFQKVR